MKIVNIIRLLLIWSAAATGFGMSPGGDQPAMMGMGAHHMVPDFSDAPGQTVETVKDGPWMDQTTWSTGLIPNQASQAVVIKHQVKYDAGESRLHSVVIRDGGHLTFATGWRGRQDARLELVHLQVLTGGTLEIDLPKAGLHAATVVFRDVPLDLERDPLQWGNGLVATGGIVRIKGHPTGATWREIDSDIPSGATQIAVRIDPKTSAPLSWQQGAELYLPDTRQISKVAGEPDYWWRPYRVKNGKALYSSGRSQQEIVRVAKIERSNSLPNLAIITLERPTKFAHKGEARGNHRPHVILLNRSLVFTSENPRGTRGHVLLAGRTDAVVEYASFENLGRTLNDCERNETQQLANGHLHLGTNVVGRYSLHAHHLIGPERRAEELAGDPLATPRQFAFRGNTVRGALRWGMVIHGSSYGLVENNVIYDVQGSGLVLEDGNECSNIIRDNAVALVYGIADEGKRGNWIDPRDKEDLLNGEDDDLFEDWLAEITEQSIISREAAQARVAAGTQNIAYPSCRSSQGNLSRDLDMISLYKDPHLKEYGFGEGHDYGRGGVGYWIKRACNNTIKGNLATNTLYAGFMYSSYMDHHRPPIAPQGVSPKSLPDDGITENYNPKDLFEDNVSYGRTVTGLWVSWPGGTDYCAARPDRQEFLFNRFSAWGVLVGLELGRTVNVEVRDSWFIGGTNEDLGSQPSSGLHTFYENSGFKMVGTTVAGFVVGLFPPREVPGAFVASPIVGNYEGMWTEIKDSNFQDNYVDIALTRPTLRGREGMVFTKMKSNLHSNAGDRQQPTISASRLENLRYNLARYSWLPESPKTIVMRPAISDAEAREYSKRLGGGETHVGTETMRPLLTVVEDYNRTGADTPVYLAFLDQDPNYVIDAYESADRISEGKMCGTKRSEDYSRDEDKVIGEGKFIEIGMTNAELFAAHGIARAGYVACAEDQVDLAGVVGRACTTAPWFVDQEGRLKNAHITDDKRVKGEIAEYELRLRRGLLEVK